MRIYMIRHGETDLNKKGCYYGMLDARLTEEGVKQAKQIGEVLKDISFDYVYASPLTRASDTAAYILGQQSHKVTQEIQKEVRLSEQSFGIFEGMPYGQLKETFPEELDAWNHDFSDYVIPEGESFSQVRKRVASFVKELPKGQGTILLVAHKGTLGHLLAEMLHMPLDGYWNFVFEQGCYNVVDLEDGYAIIRRLNTPA